MALTTQQLRDYVRAALDTDDEELPDALVDVWRSDADGYIARYSDRWEFYQEQQQLVTVSGTWEYSLTADLGAEFARIQDVYSDARKLRGVEHDAALRRFGTASTTATTDTPTHWSQWNGSLYIWPRPAAVTLQVRGFRKPVIGQDPPDFPDEFHPLVGEYMLARAYEFEDDEIMSVQKFQRIEQLLLVLRPRFEQKATGVGHVIGGGEPRFDRYRDRDRLLFDFEV